MIDASKLYENNVVWKIVPFICGECGTQGFSVKAFIGDQEVMDGVFLDNINNAIAFINSLKKAGIAKDE